MTADCAGFRLQPDWDVAYRSKDKSVWFHEYADGSTTTYHKLNFDGEHYVPDNDSYSCTLLSSTVLQLKSNLRPYTKTFQSADSVILSSYTNSRQPDAHLCCMDIGPSGELGLSASTLKNNSLCLWETETGHVRRSLSGHAGEVYSCRFFPSGLAALTAGADMQLKIWCLLTGTCAVTLSPGLAGAFTGGGSQDSSANTEPGGHRSAILDTGIIDRGRNVVAIDRTGWLRLWDVSQQLCFSAMPLIPNASNSLPSPCPIMEAACCLAVKTDLQLPLTINDAAEPTNWYQALETSAPLVTEVGTSNALVAVGMGSGGRVQLYELSSRKTGCVAQFTLENASGSIESCAFPTSFASQGTNSAESMAFMEYGLFAGGHNGELSGWDLRCAKTPLLQLLDEKGAVLKMAVYRRPNENHLTLVSGRSDGRVMVHKCNPSSGVLEIEPSNLELTGINTEPVRGLAVVPNAGADVSVWTASMNGMFRGYKKLATDVAFS